MDTDDDIGLRSNSRRTRIETIKKPFRVFKLPNSLRSNSRRTRIETWWSANTRSHDESPQIEFQKNKD